LICGDLNQLEKHQNLILSENLSYKWIENKKKNALSSWAKINIVYFYTPTYLL
jgi:hypothetical protein